jgi:hypothetical protein
MLVQGVQERFGISCLLKLGAKAYNSIHVTGRARRKLRPGLRLRAALPRYSFIDPFFPHPTLFSVSNKNLLPTPQLLFPKQTHSSSSSTVSRRSGLHIRVASLPQVLICSALLCNRKHRQPISTKSRHPTSRHLTRASLIRCLDRHPPYQAVTRRLRARKRHIST